MVDPNANAAGSTSVACWLEAFVNVSVLSLVSGIGGAGGGGDGFEWLPDPQASDKESSDVNNNAKPVRSGEQPKRRIIALEFTPKDALPSLTEDKLRTYNRRREGGYLWRYTAMPVGR
jgi:hypothetical protein